MAPHCGPPTAQHCRAKPCRRSAGDSPSRPAIDVLSAPFQSTTRIPDSCPCLRAYRRVNSQNAAAKFPFELCRALHSRTWPARCHQMQRHCFQFLSRPSALCTMPLPRPLAPWQILEIMDTVFNFFQRVGRQSSSARARASPTKSTEPLAKAISTCARVLKPPVSINGLDVPVRARSANSRNASHLLFRHLNHVVGRMHALPSREGLASKSGETGRPASWRPGKASRKQAVFQ